MDIELPMCLVELPACLSDPTMIQDARLTMFDVLLVRDDVEVSEETQNNYSVFLGSPPAPLAVQRGYVAVDATVANRTYRVVSTHLEAFSPPIRNAQAAELITVLEGEALPVILLGDFNSSPDIEPGMGIDDSSTYMAVTEAGFVDMWKGEPDTGFTCCQAPDLTGDASLSKRIDFIFVRNSSTAGAASIDTDMDDAFTVGDEPADRVLDEEGILIWPSDHVGVGAVLYVD